MSTLLNLAGVGALALWAFAGGGLFALIAGIGLLWAGLAL